MYLHGLWKIAGEHIAIDPEGGLILLQKAAAKNYGPAIYEIARRKITGVALAKDEASGLRQMQEAATLGSAPAQLFLGRYYESGTGLPKDPDRARRNYRLCAAQGVVECQHRLGLLLLDAPSRLERDYMQALALLQLAMDGQHPGAKEILEREAGRLTDEQKKWVRSLTKTLAPR